MKARHANFANAHHATFQWIFNDESKECKYREWKPIKFVEWLLSKSGIYFIMGKPGAGKSTLMKFLVGHPKTKDLLESWADGKQLVMANYFFWHSGTKLQKSQQGLLQSLLFKVLRKCPELIPKVCKTFIDYLPFQDGPDAWNVSELLDCFRLLRAQDVASAEFCFFVDGLDEYDISKGGSPNDLVKVLDELFISPDIKICDASRPWNEFRDHYAQNDDLYLTLENLTKPDMRHYVKQTLEEKPQFLELKLKDSFYPALVDEIVNKAQGVFLVVTSLSKGISNADRISDLRKRLEELPGTLVEYFRHIFNSVDEVYKVPTAQAFQYAMQAAEPLSVITFSFLDDLDDAAILILQSVQRSGLWTQRHG